MDPVSPSTSSPKAPHAVRITPRNGPIAPPFEGLPRSKSHTQRALLIGAVRGGATTIQRPLQSVDTQALARALRALGLGVTAGENWQMASGFGLHPTGSIDVEENGTAFRTLAMLLPMLGGRVSIDARPGLKRRPHGDAWSALRSWGADVRSNSWPVRLDGTAIALPDPLVLDLPYTTQFASGGLLGSAARHRLGLPAPSGFQLRAARDPGYVELTAAMLVSAGFDVRTRVQAAGAGDAVVHGRFGSPAAPQHGAEWRYEVPVDPSSATFAHVLAALRGDHPPPPGASVDAHPEHAVIDDIRQLLDAPSGSTVVLGDIAQRPDAFPALAMLAATRPATTRFAGIGVLRTKETDRIAAVQRGLTACGVDHEADSESLVVVGPLPTSPSARDRGPIPIPCAPDHRIVMAFALLGTVLPGGVIVDHPEAVAKSWPGYFDWLADHAQVEPID